MAYMSQENKASKAPAIKAILKKYNCKGTLSINNYSTLVLTIPQGSIDFLGNHKEMDQYNNRFETNYVPYEPTYLNVCVPHYIDKHYSGTALSFLKEIIEVMMQGNHNNSDSQSDYFDIGFYIDINIGKWNKPYNFIKG
jgi:hypothetical protein